MHKYVPLAMCAWITCVWLYTAVLTQFKTAGLPCHTSPVLDPNPAADSLASVPV